MRLTFTIGSLQMGGAERTVVTLAKGLASRGHRLTVITLSGPTSDFFEVPPGVDRVALEMQADSRTPLHAVANNARRLAALRRVIVSTRPAVVVAYIFENGVLNLLATRGTGIPVVVVEMSDPLRQRRRDVWVGLRRLTYPWAARVVSPSRGTDSRFRWLPDHRRAVIHNPLPDVDRPGEVLFPRDGRRRIVGLARLVHEKGFDLLIPAFARLAWAHPDWDLWIVGEGAQRRRLEGLVEAHGLQGRVFLPGSMVNPFPLLKAANLFALSSRFEGMAGALVEALACGIPAVSFDCPSGPAEIIREGIDGTLVPPEDEQALAAALALLMRDDALRVQMGARAVEVRGRFHVDHIVRQWEAVFEDLITRQPSGSGSIP